MLLEKAQTTKKYTLYLGLNDKDTKTQKFDTITSYKITQDIILNHTDGATISLNDGIYTYKNGEIIIEKTLKIELLFINEIKTKAIIQELKERFNQESIAIQEILIKTDLI